MISKLEILGIVATLIGVVSFAPVVNRVKKTKKAEDFPFIGLFFALASNLIWIYYGHIKGTRATMFMGFCYVIIYGFILSVKMSSKL
jgi:uncharacterized protein with PQ loop repeat